MLNLSKKVTTLKHNYQKNALSTSSHQKMALKQYRHLLYEGLQNKTRISHANPSSLL